jgi:hypothetical protein
MFNTNFVFIPTKIKICLFVCSSSIVCSLLLLRCQYNDYPFNPKIRIINASPDAPLVDFQLNKKFKAESISFGSASSYIDSSTGDIAISASPTGVNHRIVYTSCQLLNNQFYTFIIDDSVKNIATNLLIDDRSIPANGEANIRLLHLIDNNESYDVSIGTSVIFLNRTFNDVMFKKYAYQAISPGKVTLDFRLTGTSAILFSISDLTYESNKLYTIVIYGSANQKPNFSIINDN